MDSSKDPSKSEQLEQPNLNSVLTSPATQNAIKLVGESFLPGASLMMNGQIAQGGAHMLVGAVAKMLLGPIGVAVVIGNSFSSATTGKNLLQHLSSLKPPKPAE